MITNGSQCISLMSFTWSMWAWHTYIWAF